MKTVKEIGDDVVASLIIRLEGDEGVQKILQEWANDIIEKCAKTAYEEAKKGPIWAHEVSKPVLEIKKLL